MAQILSQAMVRFSVILFLYSFYFTTSFAQAKDVNGYYVVDNVVKTYYKTDNGLPFKEIVVDYDYNETFKCINITKTSKYNNYYTHSRDNKYENCVEETWIKSGNSINYTKIVNDKEDNTHKIVYTLYDGRITNKSIQNYRDGSPYVAYNTEYSYKNIKNKIKLTKITHYWAAWNNRLKGWEILNDKINRNVGYDEEDNIFLSEGYDSKSNTQPFPLRQYYYAVENNTNIGLFVLTNTYDSRPDITINEIELSCDWIGLKSSNVVDSFNWIAYDTAFKTKYEMIGDKVVKIKIYDRKNNLFSTIDINYLF